MRLKKARITNYRSIKDSGWIDFEENKTILVGPNEAGKTALLRALQQINPPEDVQKFDILRDYPRKDYNDITTKRVDPSAVDVAVGHFALDDQDKAAIDPEFGEVTYVCGRRLDNSSWQELLGGPERPTTELIKKDLRRLAAHIDSRQGTEEAKSSAALEAVLAPVSDRSYYVEGDVAAKLIAWLEKHLPLVDEDDEKKKRSAMIGSYDNASTRIAETRR